MSPNELEEREIEGPDGGVLFVRHWLRGLGERGLLAIVPGFSDHGARYPKLVERALGAGFHVASFDTRGHGRSSGVRGHVERFSDFGLDLDRFLSLVRREWLGERPLFVWGHSMGALILLDYLSSGFGRGSHIAAAVACAPSFRVAAPIPRWKTLLARGLSRLAPTVAFASPVRLEDLSRDLKVGADYKADPLVHGVSTPRLYTELTRTADRILGTPVDYGVPTLFIHGTDDTLIDISGTKLYFERSPLRRKELRLYEGARHEVHNDPAVDDAWRDAEAFFTRQGGSTTG